MSERAERIESYYQQSCWDGLSKLDLVARIIDMQDAEAALKARNASLEKDSRFLAALHAHGVDNWDGYGLAFEGED